MQLGTLGCVWVPGGVVERLGCGQAFGLGNAVKRLEAQLRAWGIDECLGT
ncbi:hypothetical protein COLSTE_00038 [Collinsella stercoris DSM 13279]|uniref:Uncharacterized protein n=1 Tax=Collinsella stercoris DSM 13279 TaxID=445975 RepID=B6G7J9_9ACTN|nr:hypothetical protein COLSTE_00038 [Collinsella stercoris DSM 13279]